MKLYLVQHGLAVDKSIDAERPLSEQGRSDVEGMATWLQKANIQIACVYHSGKTRAQQTAKIFADNLQIAQFHHIDGIKPNDEIEPMVKIINNLDSDTMIVGHLPFMQRMVSTLLCGSQEMGCHYQPGSVVCLASDNGQWSLQWMLRPVLISS